MTNSFQEASDRILALVHNAKNMATHRQNRRLAKDVLRACSLYVQGTRFPCDTKIFDNLATSITDKSTPSIIEEFNKVEKTLSAVFASAEQKQGWKTIRLPR